MDPRGATETEIYRPPRLATLGRDEIAEWPFSETLEFPERGHQEKLQKGVIDLINTIRTTKTVVFLDKSARPVSWMLRSAWTGLQEKGLIPNNENLPEIRYMAIGTEKNRRKIDDLMGVAKDKYKSSSDGPIIIVDEVVGEGGTLHRAFKAISQIWPDRIALVHQGFPMAPFWYWGGKEKSEWLGIKDPGDDKNVNAIDLGLTVSPAESDQRKKSRVFRDAILRIGKMAADNVAAGRQDPIGFRLALRRDWPDSAGIKVLEKINADGLKKLRSI